MIHLQVNKVKLLVLSSELLTSGAANIYTCGFDFSSDWEDVDRTAVFQARDVKKIVPLPPSGECQVPWEVLTQTNAAVYVGVYGTQNGRLIMPTVMASIGIVKDAASIDDVVELPATDVYAQILAIANDAEVLARSVREDADAGKFIGAKGDTGTTFTPSVSQSGDLSWTNDGGKANPEPVNIKGPRGKAFEYTDFTPEQLEELTGPQGPRGGVGPQGPRGEAGAQGIPGKDGTAGQDGKSAYQYAVEAGYTGTEEEYAEKLAQSPTVLVTYDATTNIASHTAGEIYDLVASGVNVVLTSSITSNRMQLYSVNDAIATFYFSNMTTPKGLSEYKYSIDKLGNVTKTSDVFTSLPNPYALTFTGAVEGIYDGSEELTINIPEGGSGSSVQPDWDQNDPAQPEYIKNRPCYSRTTTILPESVFTADSLPDGWIFNGDFPTAISPVVSEDMVIGKTYVAMHNGVEYECVAVNFNGLPCIGNVGAMTGGLDTGEPFIFVAVPEARVEEVGCYAIAIPLDGSENVTFSVHHNAVTKLPVKYLPDGGVGHMGMSDNAVLIDTTLSLNSAPDGDVNGYSQYIMTPLGFDLVEGNTYKVFWDGVEYEITATLSAIYDGIALETDKFSFVHVGTEYEAYSLYAVAFEKAKFSDSDGMLPPENLTPTFKIIGEGEGPVPIEEKFLPQAVQDLIALGIPAYATADNGKVLGVVDGQLAWVGAYSQAAIDDLADLVGGDA